MIDPQVSAPTALVPSVALSFGPVVGTVTTIDAAHPRPVTTGGTEYDAVVAA